MLLALSQVGYWAVTQECSTGTMYYRFVRSNYRHMTSDFKWYDLKRQKQKQKRGSVQGNCLSILINIIYLASNALGCHRHGYPCISAQSNPPTKCQPRDAYTSSGPHFVPSPSRAHAKRHMMFSLQTPAPFPLDRHHTTLRAGERARKLSPFAVSRIR